MTETATGGQALHTTADETNTIEETEIEAEMTEATETGIKYDMTATEKEEADCPGAGPGHVSALGETGREADRRGRADHGAGLLVAGKRAAAEEAGRADGVVEEERILELEVLGVVLRPRRRQLQSNGLLVSVCTLEVYPTLQPCRAHSRPSTVRAVRAVLVYVCSLSLVSSRPSACILLLHATRFSFTYHRPMPAYACACVHSWLQQCTPN